ncbi:MAG TPA: hypothetical protein VN840_02335 [Streptosporangiaceae bacterium]|nr:hypothetical protein [Streptosporangiaceae bacterium]
MVTRRRGIVRPAAMAGLVTGLALAAATATPSASAGQPGSRAQGGRAAEAGAAAARTTVTVARLPGPVKLTWTLRQAIQYLPPSNHSQYLVVIASRHDAWFFGGSNLAGHGVPEVLRRFRGGFRFPALPSGLHSWIAAASAQSPSNIWAVTYLGGAVLRWNGTAWKTVPRGAWRAGTQFTGIDAVGPRSVWLFGGRGRSFAGAGSWHWDSTGWTRVRGIAGGIRQGSAVSARDIWAIGGIGGSLNALFQLSGGTWRHVTPGPLAGFSYSYVLALAPGNVWVAGSVSGVPKLAHFDGSAWTRLTMPGSVAATGICRNGRGGLWVVANSGTGHSILRQRSAAGHWSTTTVSASSANEVLACTLVPGGQAAWGAGKSAGVGGHGSAAAVYGYGSLP